MNKLLQNMIGAGAVSDKLLPNLYGKNSSDNTRIVKPIVPLTKKQLENNKKISEENLLKEKRKNIYKTIRPSEYTDINNYVRYAFNNERSEFDDPRSEEAFRMYLDLEKNPQYFKESKYKPTINAVSNSKYYSVDNELEKDIFNSFKDVVKPKQILPVDEYDVNSDFNNDPNVFWEGNKQMVKLTPNDENLLIGRPMYSRARTLGQFTVSKGTDKKGDYLSYSDQYDFPEILQNKMQGNPYKIYGRIYYKDQKQKGGPIVDPKGQWAHPGQITRIPSNQITMQGVPYPVLGIGNNGQQQMMYPGQDYNFSDADYVDEYPMMQKGGIPFVNQYNFLQPTSNKLPIGYMPGATIPSTERAVSIGGENGEDAYLIPEFKYGRPLINPILEFNITGDMLGGPFDTWQEADEWERAVRHPYVEKGKNIPTPIKTWSKNRDYIGQPKKINTIKQNGGETLAEKIISANSNKDVAKEYYANQERLIKSTKSPLNIPTSLNHSTDNSNIKSKGLILRNDSIENVSGNNFLKTNRGGLNIDSVMNTYASVSNNSKLNYYSKDDGKMKIFDKYPIIKNKKSKFNFSLIN